MSVSILQVAKKAGVSHSTVSRVIRGQSNVCEETRKNVLSVMRQMNYMPSPVARAMRSKDVAIAQNKVCVAIIFGSDTQSADSFFCDIARGTEREAAKHGLCPLQVHIAGNDVDLLWHRLQQVFSAGVCGAILVGQFSKEQVDCISELTDKMVLIDGPAPPMVNIAAVESDNFIGCKIAIQHLIDQCCKKILVLTGPKKHYFSQAMAAAAKALEDQLEAIQIISTDYSSTSAKQAVLDHWNTNQTFDGIFGNDTLAIGALRGLAELQISVPEQVKVIGFDNIPLSSFTNPSLSTISVDKERLCQEAIKTLLQEIRGESENLKKVVGASLIARESTQK